MGKPELNIKESDQALMLLKAFEVLLRVEKRRDIDATPETSGPPAAAAIAKIIRCLISSWDNAAP